MIKIIYKVDNNSRENLSSMFENMNSTIVLSYLQGHMGTAWVDDLKNPKVAQVMVGIFVFYGGDPNSEAAEELLNNLPEHSLVIVETEDWKKRIESIHNGRLEKFKRYDFKKNPEYLDRNHLEKFLEKLPFGYELKKIDEDLVKEPSLHEVSPDFTSNFHSIEDYLNRGIGYCILNKGQVVCGASSYSIYDGGIEIEIGTRPEHRRKGLATVVAAALIIDCLDRGIYPSWDAANTQSVDLAEKLGYVMEAPYDTYYIHYKK
ncbi:GNAT family N-acetyltransferase [Oceanirhabdus sp. W0125-5]|uniref:GNAT family N-acetyltransferase n=1 Tax=Oceanirhabdus sp. W0125-5 TaxID=2999116 RepID=UPI0022F33F62|nr:GNAT family N-acetyltransferase [Oceanirhabdus sp. W0125-5]WBW99048.1 GNAT family N-acetyltransferase [Oceanirhabdus sp. W0125-5]